MNHDKIAHERDQKAESITQMGTWREVVTNVVKMDADLEEKISILYQAVPDVGIILTQLSLCKNKGQLEQHEYQNLSNGLLLKIQDNNGKMDFDPTLLKNG